MCCASTFCNLRLNGQGEVKVGLEGFSLGNLRAWAVNDSSVRRKDFTFGGSGFSKKDLRLQVSKDENYCVSYNRSVFVVKENKEVEIPNFNSCEFEFLDS